MRIWEERTIGRDGKKESKRSLEKLQLYLTKIPKPRNLYDLATLILYNQKNSKKVERNAEIEKMYHSLNKLYNDYNWEGRSQAYDTYWSNKKEQAKVDLMLDIELKNIPILAQRLDSTNIDYETLIKRRTEKVVVNGELVEREIRPIDDSNAKLNNINTLKNTVETLYLFMNGGATKTINKNNDNVKLEADVKTKLDNKTIFDIVDNELLEDNERND